MVRIIKLYDYETEYNLEHDQPWSASNYLGELIEVTDKKLTFDSGWWYINFQYATTLVFLDDDGKQPISITFKGGKLATEKVNNEGIDLKTFMDEFLSNHCSSIPTFDNKLENIDDIIF